MRALTFAVFCLLALASPSPAAFAGLPRTHPPLCGAPATSESIAEQPQVEVSSLPFDDLGRHELILRVDRDGDHFCYRSTLGGVLENRAPILRVHRGRAVRATARQRVKWARAGRIPSGERDAALHADADARNAAR